jgi:hypothetical protein
LFPPRSSTASDQDTKILSNKKITTGCSDSSFNKNIAKTLRHAQCADLESAEMGQKNLEGGGCKILDSENPSSNVRGCFQLLLPVQITILPCSFHCPRLPAASRRHLHISPQVPISRTHLIPCPDVKLPSNPATESSWVPRHDASCSSLKPLAHPDLQRLQMDPEGERDGEVFFDDSNGATTNLGLDFFNQPPSFTTLASHSGVRGGFPRHGAGGVEGLDLNSQAGDNTDNMSYLDLLRSSSHGLAGEATAGESDQVRASVAELGHAVLTSRTPIGVG